MARPRAAHPPARTRRRGPVPQDRAVRRDGTEEGDCGVFGEDLLTRSESPEGRISLVDGIACGYDSCMGRVYEELVNFLATGPTPAEPADFHPSPESSQRVTDLIER